MTTIVDIMRQKVNASVGEEVVKNEAQASYM